MVDTDPESLRELGTRSVDEKTRSEGLTERRDPFVLPASDAAVVLTLLELLRLIEGFLSHSGDMIAMRSPCHAKQSFVFGARSRRYAALKK